MKDEDVQEKVKTDLIEYHMGLLDKFGEGLRELIKSGEYADIFDCYFVSKQDWP